MSLDSAVYIWVRATTDWSDEAAVRAQLSPAMAPAVDLWNETFDIPFHVFRHEVRQIAALNHAQVAGAAVAAWDAIPQGALVLPVDDDDWFAPDAAAVLAREVGADCQGACWTQSTIQVPLDVRHALGLLRRRLFPAAPPRWVCATNNYALRKGVDRLPFQDHRVASAWVTGSGAGVRRLAPRLSLANRTLASITTLLWGRRTMTPRSLRRKYRRYRGLYTTLPHPELAWCEPSLQRMAALMARLDLRAR